MNLILSSSIVEPPSDSLAIYTILMISKTKFDMNILLFTEQEMKDFYYQYMKKKGLFDYIDYILTPPEKEKGLRLDDKTDNPPVIKIKNIVFENQIKILNDIRKFI